MIRFFTGFLALAAIGQLFIYWKQTGVMERSLEAAKTTAEAAKTSAEAAKTSADATALEFEMSHRPWLYISVSSAGDLTFDHGGVTAKVSVALINQGRSPANWVEIDGGIIFSEETHPAVARDNLTEALLKRKPQIANCIFPDEKRSITKEFNRNRNALNEVVTPGNRYLGMHLVLGVSYRLTFTDTVYCTSAVYHIGRLEGERYSTVVPVDENISTFSLRFDLVQPIGILAL